MPLIMLIAENAGGPSDAGERVFPQQMSSALAGRRPVLAYTAGSAPAPGMAVVPSNRPFVSLRLLREIRRRRPGVIIYIYPATFLGLLRARVMRAAAPGSRLVIIAIEHGSPRFPFSLLARFIWPDLLLVPSEMERMATLRAGAKAERLPLGVDLERYRPALPGERDQLRQKWGLPVDTDLVIHVGHLALTRNIQTLAPIASRPNTTVAVLVSRYRDPASADLAEQLRAAGITLIDGYRSDIEEFYRMADCYVFPVVTEGTAVSMPLSVLEALASGLPVVTTPFGALSDYFGGGSEAVIFAQHGEDMVKAVDKQLRLRPSGRELVEPYSWDAVADRLLQIIDRVAG